MEKNFDLDAIRIMDLLTRQDNNLQLGLLNGMVNQTIHHSIVDGGDNDSYDNIILRGAKILDKYDASDKRPLLQKVSDLLYQEHQESRQFHQKNLDAENAFLPALVTFKEGIIDFGEASPAATYMPPPKPVNV